MSTPTLSDLTVDQIAELLLLMRQHPVRPRTPDTPHRMSQESGTCVYCGIDTNTGHCAPKTPIGGRFTDDDDARALVQGKEHPAWQRLRERVALQHA